jgi:Fe-S-cluster containining protein
LVDFDFAPYFKKYEALVAASDAVFDRVRSAFADCVNCREKCADCCYALFDLTLIEALYINHRFNQKFQGTRRSQALEKANRADRRIHKLKRRAFESLKEGKEEAEILADLARERVRCPLLNERELCDLYDHRPLTCRFYGIPTQIGEAGHTCGKSGFKPGEQYPTVKLDVINAQLQQISAELVRDLKSRFPKLADLLVPLSMALTTDYDEAFLGVGEEPSPAPAKHGRSRRKK